MIQALLTHSQAIFDLLAGGALFLVGAAAAWFFFVFAQTLRSLQIVLVQVQDFTALLSSMSSIARTFLDFPKRVLEKVLEKLL